MKKINYILFIITFIISFLGCDLNGQKKTRKIVDERNSELKVDKEEIRRLIIQVLNWSQTNESIDLLPGLEDSTHTSYIGFDMVKHRENLILLKNTSFFSTEFIENYDRIIKTLDKKLRDGEFHWLVGELPPFKFNSEVNAWCLCQGFSPEQLGDVEVIKMDITGGEFLWRWSKYADWCDFKFCVIKEDNKWKISYMQGFDFKESIKEDGTL